MDKIKFFEEMLGVLAYDDPDAVRNGKIKKEVKGFDYIPNPDDMTDDEIVEFMKGLR